MALQYIRDVRQFMACIAGLSVATLICSPSNGARETANPVNETASGGGFPETYGEYPVLVTITECGRQ